MNDSPSPVPTKKRVRKRRKNHLAIDAHSAPSALAQTSDGHDEGQLALPFQTRKKTRRPRTRKTNVEVPADMIVPTDPIVSGESTPIQLAVPVGSPFPAVPPKPIKPAMLTPMALRALLPVPVDYNRAIPSPRKCWKVSGFLSKSGRAVSRTADVLRRHRQSLGLVMTAILLGISLTTIVILADAPKTAPKVEAAQAPAVVAAAPAPAPAPVQDIPAGPEESDALAGIRIVDPSWDKKMSCNEGTWPYIDQRCLVKDEKRSVAKAENKIGPRMIGSTPRPQALEPIGPIGSTTAIVPAAPKVNVTDGAAARDEDRDEDVEQEEADIRERENTRKKYEAIRKKN